MKSLTFPCEVSQDPEILQYALTEVLTPQLSYWKNDYIPRQITFGKGLFVELLRNPFS